MFKLMKYEIKGTYKFILAAVLIVSLATAGLQYTALDINTNFTDPGSTNSLMVMQILLPLVSIVLIATSIAFIVYLIQSFRKELYEDRGYLTFTLPLSGKQILGAKFITALLWTTVFGLLVAGINIIVFRILFGGQALSSINFALSAIVNDFGRGLLSGVFIYGIISSMVTLLTVYFSITLSKVAIRNRNIGGLWILIFIGLQFLFTFFEERIVSLFPIYTGLGSSEWTLGSMNNLMVNQSGLTIDIMTGNPVFSITGAIYWLILGIGLFLLTSYLLDRKIEL